MVSLLSSTSALTSFVSLSQEWHDLYAIHETNEELMEFFDHFLKGVENNFVKDTPKVRWTLLQHGDREPICNVPIPDYPVPNTDYKEFYLAPNGGLSAEPVKEAGMASYLSRGEGANSATFDIKFDKKTQLIGLPKIFLHMSCDDHDDMNVFVVLKKLDGEFRPSSLGFGPRLERSCQILLIDHRRGGRRTAR